MNNNELASLLGTVIAVLGDIPQGHAKDQIYRAASKATAEAGFGTTFMADTQNELYKAFTSSPKRERPLSPTFPDFLETLNSSEYSKKECGCPTCNLRRQLEGRAKRGVVSMSGEDFVTEMQSAGYEQGNPLLDFFYGIVKKRKKMEQQFNDFGQYRKEKPDEILKEVERRRKEYWEKTEGQTLINGTDTKPSHPLTPTECHEPKTEAPATPEETERPTNITDTLGSGSN